ncbi:DUF2283 domain-containing protein [Geoglobus acetivorans]|uniref:DUF2283 domain-containing protein n=1 Tax=Geoglobus acetivorans TaxID=565033 RepID=A0ABZ3H0Q0_GEOAI|nr:DUF2283 domain-containing protein [Geoglobus acetivorans]
MKVRCDPEADIFCISIKDEEVMDMDEIGEDVFVELNEKGEIIWY